jgi:hypothetical protein
VSWAGRLPRGQQHPDLAAVQLGAERIYMLRPTSRTLACVRGVRQGALAAASRAFTVLVRARMNPELARDATSAELIVLPAGVGRLTLRGR